MECPQMVASPVVGVYKVDSMEMVVVFPAPLGPSRLKISPSLISKEIPLTAVKSPYFFTRLLTSNIDVAMNGFLLHRSLLKSVVLSHDFL